MSNRRFVVVPAAVFAACVLLSVPARAGDDPAAPAAPPTPEKKPVPKITHPFLTSLVGSWDYSMTGMFGAGVGVSRIRMAAGGTALVQEGRASVNGQSAYALNLVRVDDGGKGARLWRFDTFSPAPITAYKGALSDDGFDVKTDAGVSMRSRKTETGFEATISRGETTMFTLTYTKAAKEAEWEAPNAPKDGHRPAMIGAWDVAGEWTMPGKDGKPATIKVAGTSTFRWTLGGAMILHDYDRTTPAGPASALGAHRWPADGASTKVWWFGGDQVDPLLADGPVTETGWRGKGAMADGKTMSLDWAKKGDGFVMGYEMDGKPAGSESYTKKK